MHIKMRTLLLVFGILPVASSYGAETTHSIILNVHGQVRDETGLPACNNGGRIKLLSYKYTYYSHDGNSQISDNGLSRRAEVTLHEMCSLKHRCTSSETKFPEADLNQSGMTVLEVSFQCLDQFETFIDICLETTKRDDKPIHLIYKGTSAAYETCQCSIQGQYTLSISDVRLKSSNSSSCSQAEMVVHNHKYMCDQTKDDYGSIFRRFVQESLSMGLIVFNTDSTGVEPEMVYLTVKPEKSIKVNCDSKKRKRHLCGCIDCVTASSYPASSVTSCTGTKSKAISNLVIVILCVLCLLLGLCLGFVICYMYLKDARRQWKKSSPENDLKGNQETHTLIPNLETITNAARGSSSEMDDGYIHLKIMMAKRSSDKKDPKKWKKPKLLKRILRTKKKKRKAPDNDQMERTITEKHEETNDRNNIILLDVSSILSDDFYKDKLVRVLPYQDAEKTEEIPSDEESFRKKKSKTEKNERNISSIEPLLNRNSEANTEQTTNGQKIDKSHDMVKNRSGLKKSIDKKSLCQDAEEHVVAQKLTDKSTASADESSLDCDKTHYSIEMNQSHLKTEDKKLSKPKKQKT